MMNDKAGYVQGEKCRSPGGSDKGAENKHFKLKIFVFCAEQFLTY